MATSIIALAALRNWQRQDRAKREAEFLDQLIDAAHAYIVEIARPIELLRLAKIGIAAHVPSWETGEESDKALQGAIAYIEKRGKEDGTGLAAALASVETSVVKLRSIATKGQVFNFPGYAQCQNAISILTWHFGRLVSFNSLVSSPTWNWDNEDVRSLLSKVLMIDPKEIDDSIGEANIAVIEFARKTYKRIYGRP